MNLVDRLQDLQGVDYPCQSRVHRLPSFDTDTCSCYVKRDDELGFGISGTKVRKYRSLLPFLLKERFDEVIVIGGVNSNNVLGLVQLLIENRIAPRLFLRGDPSRPTVGNGFLTRMLVSESVVRWLSREEWTHVEELAHQYAREQETLGRRVFVVPEGASCEQSLAGSLTLALDIQRNEEQVAHPLEHIFIDAGTGLSAIGLLLGLAYTKASNHTHVLLLADDEAAFLERLKSFHDLFEKSIAQPCPMPHRFTLYHPENAPSFGSTNARVWQEIRDVARCEGFFLDPIYSAKLFVEARRILTQQHLVGHSLLVHGGGALALAGFQAQLQSRGGLSP